jgi:cytidylate kinase
MYRAVALWAQRQGVPWDDVLRVEQMAIAAEIELKSDPVQVKLNGEDVTEAIRAPEISQGASKVSAIGGVRRALVDKQRVMAEHASVVMEGRDIGTVVFPHAQVKVFLDARPEVRADRRVKELSEKAPPPPEKQSVLKELNERDERDRTRKESPLVQAPDAVMVDTSALTIEEVEEAILRIIRDKTSNGKEFARP